MVEQLRYGGFLKWGYPQSSSILNHFNRFKKVFSPINQAFFQWGTSILWNPTVPLALRPLAAAASVG